MSRSDVDLRVVTGPAGLDVASALPAQELRLAWTRMSETSPAFSREQFVAWLHFLGEREEDKKIRLCGRSCEDLLRPGVPQQWKEAGPAAQRFFLPRIPQ